MSKAGQFSAGQDLLVGERGPEVIQMNSPGRVRTANQIRNDNSNSNGTGDINVTIIDQSTGKKDFNVEKNDDGRIIVLMRDTFSADIARPNSQISKSFSSSISAPRIR